MFFLFLNCSIINSALDKKNLITFNMENSQTVINPSFSGIQVFLEISLLSDHEKLVKKIPQKKLKLPDHP